MSGATAPSPADIEVTEITEPAAFADLAAAWDDLLSDSEAYAPFLGWPWISTWWEVFGEGAALHVLAAHAGDGTLLGLAPLMVRRGVEGFGRGLRVLLLIGQQGETLAERLDLIVRRGHEEAVVAALAGHLVRRQRALFDVLFFERGRSDSPTLALWGRALAARGLRVEAGRSQPSPYLPLPATVDALRASMSRNFRRQLANARNRLAREGHVALRFAPRDVPVEEAMDTLIALHRARWGPEEGSFRTPDYVRFHRALSRRLAARGELVLALLDVDGRTVAARYDFLGDERVWCFQGGWSPDFERMRVGTLLTEDVIRWAIARGCREYDFLCGDEPYKRRWTDQARRVVDLVAWGRGRRSWTGRRMRHLRAAVRRLLRRPRAD